VDSPFLDSDHDAAENSFGCSVDNIVVAAAEGNYFVVGMLFVDHVRGDSWKGLVD